VSRLDRRAFLEGSGTLLALPVLDAMMTRRARARPEPPRRFVAYFVPNGMLMPAWTPSSVEAELELSPILQPLAPVRDELVVLSGLRRSVRSSPLEPEPHSLGTSTFLRPAERFFGPEAPGRCAIPSVDQLIARRVGRHTPIPSLQLGAAAPGTPEASGATDGWRATQSISWTETGRPLGRQVSPRAVFERMVRGPDVAAGIAKAHERHRRGKSALDAVLEGARRLDRTLGAADRRALDAHLAGVRELELRIARLEPSTATEPVASTADDYHERVAVMTDLIVWALRCDLTRVVTFMLGDGASDCTHPFLGIDDGHHELSHHRGDPVRLEKLQAIDTWEVTRLASLLRRLREVPEGDGTLLDQTIVYFGSELSDGDSHEGDDLPVLVAGRGGGAVRPGRHLRTPGRSASDLHRSFLEAFGVPGAPNATESGGPIPLV